MKLAEEIKNYKELKAAEKLNKFQANLQNNSYKQKNKPSEKIKPTFSAAFMQLNLKYTEKTEMKKK